MPTNNLFQDICFIITKHVHTDAMMYIQTSVFVHWEEAPCTQRNGEITGYVVNISDVARRAHL